MKKERDLRPMMKPRSVAIIGASTNPEKVGSIILQNYISSGYNGKLYPVNKTPGDILGLKTYGSVLDIKVSIDLAVIAIPAPVVPAVLEECGKAGVKAVVVVSAGFAEVGNEGQQDELVRIADRYGMSMLGPNCLGVMDTRSKVNTLFLPAYKLSKPQIGGVSFMAQSGAVGSMILDLIADEGFGLSKFFSYGNAAQVDEVDILDYLMNDDETTVIVMYLEGIKRGKEFVETARKAGLKKPVIVLKAGKTAAGIKAAHSHTAALAGDYEVQEAIFRQSGFIIAEDLSDLLHYAKAFTSEPAPNGPRVAVITNGGGAGVLTTDAIASSALQMAEFADETKIALRKVMPVLVNIANPLDLAGDADNKRYSDALSALESDPNVDMLIVIMLFQTPGANSTTAATLLEYKGRSDKPMIAISAGSSYTEMHKRMMESAGLPVYDSPTDAAAALSALYTHAQFKRKRQAPVSSNRAAGPRPS